MRARAELALIAVTIVWGTTFVMVKSALQNISPLLFIGARFSLAAVVLWLIYSRAVRRSGISGGLLAGGLLFGAYALQTIGLELTTPSKSAFLTSLSVPMVPLASSFVYRVRPRAMEVLGIVISSVGTVLLMLPGDGFGVSMNRGDLLSFLCAVLFALHIVVSGHYSPISGFESLAVIQAAVVAVLGLSAAWFVNPTQLHLTTEVATAVVITGLLGTALAFTTMAWAQQYTSPTRTALIFTLEPAVAAMTSWVLMGETLTNRGKVGAGLILTGILVGELTRGRVETISATGTS